MDFDMIMRDKYHQLLLAFAAGKLDGAQALIMAAHVVMSPKARKTVRLYESLGGALLESDCAPVEMESGALECVLAKIETCGAESNSAYLKTSGSFTLPGGVRVPKFLGAELMLHYSGELSWKADADGVKAIDFPVKCPVTKMRFFKAEPAFKTAEHRHHGQEIMLVLHGGFRDHTGQYGSGDLLVPDEGFEHAPVACPKKGFTCLQMTSSVKK